MCPEKNDKLMNPEQILARMKKILVITSGGDCPGMNQAVMSIVRTAMRYGVTVLGAVGGYAGIALAEEKPNEKYLGLDLIELDLKTVLPFQDQPGTFLGTARCEEFKDDPSIRKRAAELLKRVGVDGVIIIGGDGSYQGANYLCQLGVPCIGIPGTIDNDMGYTEKTLGFDTAVSNCIDALRAVRATSCSHSRAHLIETMGRKSGNIAAAVAASAADIVMVPEKQREIDELAETLKRLAADGNTCPVIVAAEGCWKEWDKLLDYDVAGDLNPEEKAKKNAAIAKAAQETDPEKKKQLEMDAKQLEITPEGTAMKAEYFARILEKKSGVPVRHTVVGYTQRGAVPVASDCLFANMAGIMAVQLLLEDRPEDEKKVAIGIRNGELFTMPFAEVVELNGKLNQKMYEAALLKEARP